MGNLNLVIAIRLHEGRYHGAGEEHPSPARCFQALVAAASRRGVVDDSARGALEWLEKQAPPIVALPVMKPGQTVKAFVPNNDLDAKEGDPRRIEEIRTAKAIQPKLFDRTVPFLFSWPAGNEPSDADAAEIVSKIAERVYQFGRGVDMGWARARLLDDVALEALLDRFPGRVLRPSPGAPGNRMLLPCPESGSLARLEARHQAFRRRFRMEGRTETFSQPPKPRFAQVPYGSPPARRLFEIQDESGRLVPFALSRVVSLVESVRDTAAARLSAALPPALAADVERVVVGRTQDGASPIPPAARVRILPIASIGHEHADRGIRRMLVETPAISPLRALDVEWAFSASAIGRCVLAPAADNSMLRHFGIGSEPSRRWQTVTPVALPEAAQRRRIEPSLQREEAKPGSERSVEERAAMDAVRHALRHAGVREAPVSIRVQREPFEASGVRTESFAPGTRFAKERLWHVEVTFATPITGPLVIGDGRFLGLGILHPVAAAMSGVHAFRIERGLEVEPDPIGLARALRRAVMARAQAVVGERRSLPPFFTGHDGVGHSTAGSDERRHGQPARSEISAHLAFVFDLPRRRLLVLAPHVFERRNPHSGEREHLRVLEKALFGFGELRAGRAGLLVLQPIPVDNSSDPLFARSRRWESLTDYVATRHANHGTAREILAEDLRAECARRGLPAPVRIDAHSARGERGLGLTGRASLEFASTVAGPLMLGRTRFVGGGLFGAGA